MPYDLRQPDPATGSYYRASDTRRFSASHPEVPAPPFADILVLLPFASGSAKRLEIGVISAHIGSGTETFSPYRHYVPAAPARSS
jgi:hypothetical protein